MKNSTTTDIFIKNKFSKFLTTIGNEQLLKILSGANNQAGTVNSDVDARTKLQDDYRARRNKIIGDQISLSKLAELFQSIGANASGKYISEIINECQGVPDIQNVVRITYTEPKNLNYDKADDVSILNDTNLYDILNDQKESKTATVDKNKKDIEKLGKSFNNVEATSNNFNKETKIFKHEKSNPGLSVIQIIDPEMRSCFRNSQEIDLFFNMISTMDISTSMPYVRAEFLVPEYVSENDRKGAVPFDDKNKKEKNYLVATLNNFLNGELKADNLESTYTKTAQMINGDGDLEEYTTQVRKGVASKEDITEIKETTYKRRLLNTSLFFSPQTMTNGDYNIDQDRFALIDKFRPFMSIMSLSFDVRPTKGLLFYKTGQLELMLYDKARMNQVAPFIKPELLNTVASEIILEYGWQNNSGDSQYTQNDQDLNPIGEFLNTLKVREKYIIVNSSYNINENGTVGISLNLAMKGPAELRGGAFARSSELNELNNSIQTVMRELTAAVNKSEIGDTGDKSYASVHQKLTEIQEDSQIDIAELDALKTEIIKDRAQNSSKLTNTKYTELITIVDKLITKRGEANKELNNVLSDFKFLDNDDDPFLTDEVLKIVSSDEGAAIAEYRDAGDNQQNELKINSQVNAKPGDYISLGKIISGIISIGLLSKKNYNEIQLIFYNINGKAAKASYVNIAAVPVHKARFKNFLIRLIKTSSKISTEGLLTNILKYCINEKAADVFGLRRFYKFNKNNSSEFRMSTEFVEDAAQLDFIEEAAEKDKNSEQRKNIASLREIQIKNTLFVQYYGVDEFNNLQKQQQPATIQDEGLLGDLSTGMYDLTFVKPNVVFSFESTSHISDKKTNILRIHLYDENDNPYESLTEILTQYHSGIYDNAISSINRFRAVKQKIQAEITTESKAVKTENEQQAEIKDKKKETKTEEATNKNNKIKKIESLQKYQDSASSLLIKSLINDNILVFIDKNGKVMDSNTDITDKNIKSIKINVTRQTDSFKSFKQLKNNFKSFMPSLTLGHTNSALLSGNVTTSQDPKYSTVQMMRSMEDIKDNPVQDVEYSLFNDSTSAPMYVIPSQASASIIGCPLINFSQLIFLDFNTGTSIDNMYFVNGIKHSISPGKFSTDLTLIQSDLYSRFEAHANNIQQFIKTLRTSNSFLADNLKLIEKISKNTAARDNQPASSTQTSAQVSFQKNLDFQIKISVNADVTGPYSISEFESTNIEN